MCFSLLDSAKRNQASHVKQHHSRVKVVGVDQIFNRFNCVPILYKIQRPFCKYLADLKKQFLFIWGVIWGVLMIFITCFKRIIFLIGTPAKLLKIWAALV